MAATERTKTFFLFELYNFFVSLVLSCFLCCLKLDDTSLHEVRWTLLLIPLFSPLVQLFITFYTYLYHRDLYFK